MTSANKTLLLFFILFSIKLFAQSSLQKQFDYAYSLFNNEKYFDAVTEFKRLLCFDKENKYAFNANLYIGLSYKNGGIFDYAMKYFTLAEMKSQNKEEYFSAKIYEIRTNIRRRTILQANKILDELDSDKNLSTHKNEINYWRGWAYIFSDDWQDAYQIFSQNNLDSSLARLCQDVDQKKYSVDFAKYSSVILPGFGQFYTGEYVSGLISLGWNLLFGYLTINSFVEDRVFDGIVVGNFLWLRFYSGNIQNSEKFAEQKNLQISNSALDYLQFKFSGLKP